MAKISIRDDVDPGTVMDVTEQAATSLGYQLERTSDTAATAHEGGRKVRGNVAATWARSGIEVTRGRVKLKPKSNGTAYAAASTPFFIIRISSQNRRFAKHLAGTLASAGLTTAAQT